jgi:hypothetical protein
MAAVLLHESISKARLISTRFDESRCPARLAGGFLVKREKEENRDAKPEHERENQASGQFATAHYVRRFETAERICEGTAIISGILLSGMSAFGGHKIAMVWTTGLGLCAVILAVCFWVTDRELLKERTAKDNQPHSTEAQINSIDALREEGRKLQRIFAAPTGNLPDDEPDRWLEKVQICLRSISSSYGERFDEILKDPRRYAGALSPELNQSDMTHWMNDDPRRQHQWPRITAVLNHLDQIRGELGYPPVR